MVSDRLKTELETYEKNKADLVANFDGKFVVITGGRIVGQWSTYEDAVTAGYDECGLDQPFLVKQICENERIHFITPGLIECR